MSNQFLCISLIKFKKTNLFASLITKTADMTVKEDIRPIQGHITNILEIESFVIAMELQNWKRLILNIIYYYLLSFTKLWVFRCLPDGLNI